MSYCDTCIHHDVCGVEGVDDEAMTYCADRLEPCEEAISRQAAIASIKNLYPDMPIVNIMNARQKWLEKYAPYFECENAIEHLPSVNPTKTGHWITTRTFMHDGEFYCDKCKCDAPNNEKWDYCPNCGARMESEG